MSTRDWLLVGMIAAIGLAIAFHLWWEQRTILRRKNHKHIR